MRTTIRIDDDLYRDVKARAAREGRTVGQVIEDALRAQALKSADDVPLEPLPTFGGPSGVRPGVDLADIKTVLSEMDEEKWRDALR